jgi:ribosome-binding protein aMBF1 (putative translation factor)
MSVHTKTLRIRPRACAKVLSNRKPKAKTVNWRDAAKEDLDKYSEAGQMLRGARFKADLTQKELADSLGIHVHHISEMEHGKRTIGKAMAKRLAAALKVDYRVFL